MLFFVSYVSIHRFADDNTLRPFTKLILELINILQSESEKLFNKTVDTDKFEAIPIAKTKCDHTK